jgi:YHS domain-containing protein
MNTARFRRLMLALLMSPLLWVSAGFAQSYSSPNSGPFKTQRDGADLRLMLDGHDPVAYFVRNSAVKGDAAISLEHKGVTFRFADEANRERFYKAPEQYMPQFGGYCSNGINYAIAGGGGGGPNTWRIYRGKLYVFGGRSARDHFEMDTERNLALAHKYWNEELAGVEASVSRARRLSDRVPHYRSDRSLQDEYDGKLAAKSLPVMPGAEQVVPAR